MKITGCYIDETDRSGFTFGVDDVTPVTYVFSNRVPKSAYASFTLGVWADSEKVQEWIKALPNKRVIMSKRELVQKLSKLYGEDNHVS